MIKTVQQTFRTPWKMNWGGITLKDAEQCRRGCLVIGGSFDLEIESHIKFFLLFVIMHFFESFYISECLCLKVIII